MSGHCTKCGHDACCCNEMIDTPRLQAITNKARGFSDADHLTLLDDEYAKIERELATANSVAEVRLTSIAKLHNAVCRLTVERDEAQKCLREMLEKSVETTGSADDYERWVKAAG